MKRLRIAQTARWVAAGIVIYLAALVVTLPAAFLAWSVARASNGTIVIGGASGTLWHGRGELHIHGTAPPLYLGKIEWSIDPWWLAAGRAQIVLDAQGPGTSAHTAVRWGGGRLVITGLDAVLPAHWASAIYGPAGFFAPTGELRVSAGHIEIDHGGLHGDAEILWNGAGGRFTGIPQLGDYRLALNGQGETAILGLSTLAGSLELTGKGQWRVTGDGQINFKGTAAARADHAQLGPLLETFGRDLGDGRRPLTFSTRAPLVTLLGL